jgi:hypothetical protein
MADHLLILVDVIALKARQHQHLHPLLQLHLSFQDPHLLQGIHRLRIPARREVVISRKDGHL